MTKHKVSDLEGNDLDRAVALAQGDATDAVAAIARGHGRRFMPSVDWQDGGPVIAREGIGLLLIRGKRKHGRTPATPDEWIAGFDPSITYEFDWHDHAAGPTPLIAAMRALVASKLGAEVELP